MYYSFILLKPETLERGLVPSVLERLISAGIKIEIFNYVFVSEDLIDRHYGENIEKYGNVFQERAHRSFIGKYVIPVIVSSQSNDIIHEIRTLVGATDPTKAEPGTIRADFGMDSIDKAMSEGRCCENLIHASDSLNAYLYESALWFGKKTTEKIS
jgi:nucleoside-diphosphate kinase